LFAVAVAILVAEGEAPGHAANTQAQDAGAFALLGVASAALLFRRRHPVAVFFVVTGCAYAWWFAARYDSRAINIPYMVALYAAAVTGTMRRTVAIGVLIAAGNATALILISEGLAIQRWFTGLGWTVAALLLGETVRARSELAEASVERARRAEAESDRRLVEERLRIARDLHDVLAHTVSVMSVQAEVASDALDRDRTETLAALRSIRTAARAAMGEVRATVAVLRSGTDSTGTAPSPRIDRVGDVVDGARDHGLRIDLDVGLSDRALPEVVELTVYRVVQEAITNVIRHADASSATVQIREAPPNLTVEVRDDGRQTNGTVTPGFGLRGMAERVESIGGELWHGYDGESGWVVRASLPMSGVAG
jgi:uncharacterized protein (TIGR03382 family)